MGEQSVDSARPENVTTDGLGPSESLLDARVGAESAEVSAPGAIPSNPVAASVAPAADNPALLDLTAAVDRLTDGVRAGQDVITRMQARIEALQADQVRALLGPAVTELANLHADFAESAGRDYERLGFDRVRKELTLLADRIESAIDLLGASSLDARVGDVFDSRGHQAVKQVPTADAAHDKTIAAVLRQGFTFDPDGRPALYARVHVYIFDASLAAQAELPAEPSDPPSSGSIHEPDDELELPVPLDPK